VKPSFWKSLSIASLPRDTRLHFIGLFNYADDHGRGIDDSRLLKAEIWPLDDDITARVVEEMMRTLAQAGKLVRYADDQREYFQIRRWTDHQKISKPQPSVIPPEGGWELSRNGQGTLLEHSRLEGKGREGKGKEGSTTSFEREQAAKSWSDEHFDRFWDAYPRHQSKVAARQKFVVAVGKMLKVNRNPEELILAAQRYADDPNREPAFTKLPTTWLNQGAWDDEPLPDRGSRPGGNRPDRAAAIAAQARGALP